MAEATEERKKKIEVLRRLPLVLSTRSWIGAFGFKELLLWKCEERSDEHLRNNAIERSEGAKCRTEEEK
jgi:hypothetical protein